MYSLYEILLEAENDSTFKPGEVLPARQITARARQRGFVAEVNSDIGQVEVYDNDLNRIAEAVRIYV